MMFSFGLAIGLVLGLILMALYAHLSFTTKFQKLGADVMSEIAKVKALIAGDEAKVKAKL